MRLESTYTFLWVRHRDNFHKICLVGMEGWWFMEQCTRSRAEIHAFMQNMEATGVLQNNRKMKV